MSNTWSWGAKTQRENLDYGMRRHASDGLMRLQLASLVLVFVCGLGCSRVEPRVPYPHESILTIVANSASFFSNKKSLYATSGHGSGRSQYLWVSLERLTQLDQLLDPGYADVLAFARGECLERLGAWEGAAAAFAQAAATSSTLVGAATQRATNAARMAELTDRSKLSPTLEGCLNDLEVMQHQLRAWSDRTPGWPISAFINLERERAQEDYARLLFTNRMVLDRGTERALEAAQGLTVEHARSARAMHHQIAAGTMLEALARDWTVRNRPEENGMPESSPWNSWVSAAREAYRKAALADGDPAKPEAQARLRALDAYALRMQNLAR